jgi:hypothetical protein
MIKFSEIKKGDYLVGEFDGNRWEGEVTNLNKSEKQVCVDTGVQEFWFTQENLYPITLDEEQLMKLQFQKLVNEDGSVKYMKGAFRILTPEAGNFNKFEIWYRQEHRHIMHPIHLHQLQNHYHDMTNVHLTSEAFQ